MPDTPTSSTPSTLPTLRAAQRVSAGREAPDSRHHLALDGVSFEYPDRRVLTDLTFTARAGDRIGLIGENGTGKSTLLRLIAGALAPTSGTLSVPVSTGLLEQRLPYPGHTPMAVVLDDAQRAALQVLDQLETLGAALAAQPEDASIAEAYSAALETAELSGAWAAEAKRSEVLTGLGLAAIAPQRTIDSLSGGQQLRLALAALILRAPFMLLLDEPSNHLDDASVAYLERVLGEWPGIVLYASHDRALLDAVSTKVLDLDPLPLEAGTLDDAEPAEDQGAGYGVRLWGVGYSAARTERAAEMRRWHERYEAEQAKLRALAHEIEVGSREVNRKHEPKSEAKIARKFYADKDARVTARRARNARVRLEALERTRVRKPPEPLRFHGFTEHGQHGAFEGAVLVADKVTARGRLADTSLTLCAGERLLLTGPNGAGKSTLLAMLAGVLTPDTGTVTRHVSFGYLPQEVGFHEPARSACDTYRTSVGDHVAERLTLADTGLLAQRDLHRPVGSLSVGQQRRLGLAILVADVPPLLLLDEPTNHLSLTLVEELEQALQGYTGTLVIASHDRWLRARWQGEVLTLAPS